MARIIQLTLLSILLSLGAVAAPSWDAFHNALDYYEYEKARELAQAFPTGGPRELALAEVEVLATWRAERTFAYTDAISLDKLAPELRAKYYYVRAHQEYHTARGSTVEKQKAVKRMLDEGLSQKESSSHDIAQLLLYQIPSSTYLGVEPEQLLKRLANLPGIDPAIVLRGQAFLASSQKQPEQAASLWTMLARDARRTGHLRAATFAEIHAISARRVASQANLITARGMLKEAVAAGDAYCVGRLWGMRDEIPAASFNAWHQEIARACSALPLSRAKVEVMFELTSHGRAPEPARTQIEREGVKLARQIGDNCLEFKFLSNQMNSKDPAVARLATERREALMAKMDLRGQQLYLKNPIAGGKSQTPADKSEYTLEDVEADLAALDPELGPKERIFVYHRFISRGYGTGDYALAETCFFRGLEESLRLEGVDQQNGLNFLIPCVLLDGSTHRSSGLQTLEGDLAGVASQAIGEKLRRQPALASRALSVRLDLPPSAPLAEYFATNIAEMLYLMGRREEAMEAFTTAQRYEKNEGYQALLKLRIGGLVLEQGNPAGFELLSQGYQIYEAGRADAFAKIGWEALKLGRNQDAADWAVKSLAAPQKNTPADLLKAQVYPLHALALAGLSRYEEGLQALEKGQAVAAQAQVSGGLTGYAPVKADLLLRMGKPADAAAVLVDSPMPTLAKISFYELNLRRRVAAATQDEAATEAIDQAVRAFLTSPGVKPDDPVFARRLAAALNQPAGPAPAPGAGETFTEVSEGLERLRRREPTNETLKRLAMADMKRLARSCEPDEVVVMPAQLRNSLAFVAVSPTGVRLLEVFCDQEHLAKASEALMTALSTPQSRPETQSAEWEYLASHLIEPWRELFPQARRLRWMAPRSLATLPLCALRDVDGKLLRENMTVAVIDGPSRQEVHLDKGTRALLVGGASDLTGSTRELEEIRELFPGGALWQLDGDLAQLQQELSRSRLMHISTHAAVPSAKSLSGALRGDGGAVSAFQLSELVFPAGSLAVVAACQSAVDANTGRDNTSLVGALRTAGADAVVGSLWELDDEATAVLVGHFYERVRQGDAPDVALAAAQSETARKWPHPFYWAGLQVVTGP